MPVLRFRQEEQKVLTSFYFGRHMYPGIEVIKEVDRMPQSFRNGKKLKLQAPKSFEQIHVPLFLN